MKKFFRSVEFRLLLVSFVCMPVLFYIFKRVYPEASIDLPVSRQDIRDRAENFLSSLGYDMTWYSCDIKLVHNTELLDHAQRSIRDQDQLRQLSDSLNVYQWECRWNSKKPKTDDTLEVRVSMGDERSGMMRGDCFLSMTPGGHPIEMELRTLPDSAGIYQNMDRDQIRDRLFRALHPDSSEWGTGKTEEVHNAAGEVTRTQWSRKRPVAGLETHFAVQMSGTRILSFKTESVFPQKPASTETVRNLIDVLSFLLVYLLFVVLGILFLIKRLRADLVELLSGFVPGLIVALCWSVIFWHNTDMGKSWESWLGFVITLPFVSGALWALFALGESFTREVCPEKLKIADQLRKGALTTQLGQALIRGIMLGIICLSFHAVLWMVNIRLFKGYILPGEPVLSVWSSPVPVIFLLASSVMGGLFITVTYCLFFLSLLKRYTRHVWIVLVLASVVWSMICIPITECASTWFRFPVNIILGLFIVGIFLRSEFFTTLFTIVFSSLFYQVLVFFSCKDGFYRNQAFILSGLIGMLAVLGLWLVSRKQGIPITSEYVPDYMRRITHRKELQRELEIARNVQVNLLPQQNPGLPGLEIASLCVPAREVGGDYFDFVRLGDRKLGIVIGDVSGKGIPAAFYMTLTKGLLKSQAAGDASPRDVLVQLNQLFFENSKRGVFISMIYAVFDLEKKSMTMARAGHNPMLLYKAQQKILEEICPPGIAIGFEHGAVFEKTIEELSLEIRDGDMILFYTDGLNEAQNPENEALGEKHLQQLLVANADRSAEAAIGAIGEAIQKFTGEAEQHDDMTAVLVKVVPSGSGRKDS